MSVCESCKHWQTERRSPHIDTDKARCDRLEDSGAIWSEAWEKDGVYTAATFGCNLFEEKDHDG